jgi:hypothetical protein
MLKVEIHVTLTNPQISAELAEPLYQALLAHVKANGGELTAENDPVVIVDAPEQPDTPDPESKSEPTPAQTRPRGKLRAVQTASDEALPLPPEDETPDLFVKPADSLSSYDAKSEAEKGDIARSLILTIYGASPAGKDAVRALRRTLKVAKLDDAPSEELLSHAVQLATQFQVALPPA